MTTRRAFIRSSILAIAALAAAAPGAVRAQESRDVALEDQHARKFVVNDGDSVKVIHVRAHPERYEDWNYSLADIMNGPLWDRGDNSIFARFMLGGQARHPQPHRTGRWRGSG